MWNILIVSSFFAVGALTVNTDLSIQLTKDLTVLNNELSSNENKLESSEIHQRIISIQKREASSETNDTEEFEEMFKGYTVSSADKKKIKNKLKNFCTDRKEASDTGYEMRAVRKWAKCIKKSIDIWTLKKDIDKTMSKGIKEMNKLIENYCGKGQLVKDCVDILANTILACMNKKMRPRIRAYQRGFHSWVDFVCTRRKGTFKSATFIQEDGLKCATSKIEEIKKCIKTASKNAFWEDCNSFKKFADCEKAVAKTCSKPVVGVLITDMFKHMHKNLPCTRRTNRWLDFIDRETPLSTVDTSASPVIVNASASTVNAPTSTVNAPVATVKAPTSTVNTPALTVHAPASTVNTPALTVKSPALTVKAPALTVKALASTVNKPELTVKEPASTVNTPALTVNASASFVNAPVSTVRTPASSEIQQRIIRIQKRSASYSGSEEAISKFKKSSAGQQRLRTKLRKYCLKNNATIEEADDVMAEMWRCIRCLRKIIDPKHVKKELEMARPFGKKGMKKLFGKYCEKHWALKKCIFTLTNKVVWCMPEDTQGQIDHYNTAITSVINYSCREDAERIALFYADKGAECFQEKFGALSNCTEEFEDEQFWDRCHKFKKFSKCAVEVMKGCPTVHPHRLTDGLLKAVYRDSVCQEYEDQCAAEKKAKRSNTTTQGGTTTETDTEDT